MVEKVEHCRAVFGMLKLKSRVKYPWLTWPLGAVLVMFQWQVYMGASGQPCKASI